MNKIRVAMITNDLNNNGISNVVMNYCLNINKLTTDMTIIAGSPIYSNFRTQCKESGIKLIELPERKVDTKTYYHTLYRVLSNKKYDIVQVHGNSATITVELLIAKLKGIKVRIAHCHNSTCNNMKVHKILLPIFKRVYTHGFACSSLAGDWLFRKKPYTVLVNGFIISKFIFDGNKREEVRKELGLEDKYIIGTVARFNDQKNHSYLLKVFEAVAKEREDVYLLLVGAGPNLEFIKKLIVEHPYRSRIVYYGETSHAEYIYDAIDVFVLPSKYEGLGIVFLEAQINGLPVVTSDTVPREVNIGNRTVFLHLDDDVTEWKKEILNAQSIDRNSFYDEHDKEIQIYDIRKNADRLIGYYEEMLRQR